MRGVMKPRGGIHYNGDKRRVIEDVFGADPSKTATEIAKTVGASVTYTCRIVNILKLQRNAALEKAASIVRLAGAKEYGLQPWQGEALRIQPPEPDLSGFEISGLPPASVSCGWKLDRVQIEEMNRRVLFGGGSGLSGPWPDAKIFALLEGVMANVVRMLHDLDDANNQAQFAERARALRFYANHVTQDVAPIARAGTYRGMPGGQYFKNVANWLRHRSALGQVGGTAHREAAPPAPAQALLMPPVPTIEERLRAIEAKLAA